VAWHLVHDRAVGYAIFAASVAIGGWTAFYLAYRRDPRSMIPEVAAQTWKGALAFSGVLVGIGFGFLPLPEALAGTLIVGPSTIGLIRLLNRFGFHPSGPFAMRCPVCSAPVSVKGIYCPFCGGNVRQQV
jgi:hypothetical protein